jgi:hypothetical protein
VHGQVHKADVGAGFFSISLVLLFRLMSGLRSSQSMKL